ncbi:molecular chaperone TorD family protein [Akkermansiaceae bacterium]|nr:molecular chaperone TorD family protein [Akkermansiaceae bacterium]MDB4283357.1 molecular chaperone TorD family protein [Akkermansiaceae bacterium]MDB4626882.1 molecular chaperone TorD family protein [Akkermansiaceae bacterium]MDB4667605.1 molecular chaperone TorD family protein [Akkermansiaceae bacterium]MDB4781539.1 molecular chaperone TorD family protein [Akkermansiaceae bacterium]
MNPEAAVQQLAATLLAREVNPELLATLQEPSTAAILKQLEPTCAELLEREWTKEDFDDAAAEFCRLFILEPAVPARAAAYFTENDLEIAARIQFMLDNGFLELPEGFQTLSPDHIAILLLVQTTLAGEDAVQFKKDNLSWLPEFSGKLASESGHPFYQLAAKLISLA